MKTRTLILAALLLLPACAHAQTATNGIQAQRHVAHESDLASNVVRLAPNQLGLADDAPTHIYRGTSAGNVLAIGSAGAAGPQGSKGDTGQTGAMGSQGIAGATGQPGEQGPSGPNFPWSFLGNPVTTAPTSINVTGAGATLSALGDDLTLDVPGYTLPAATATTLGGVVIGSGLSVTSGGVLSASGGGTVTSVGLTLSGFLFSVTSGRVTGSGTLSASLLTQAANTVLAGPTSGSGTPSFRGLVSGDLPVNPVLSGNVSTTGSLTLPNNKPLNLTDTNGNVFEIAGCDVGNNVDFRHRGPSGNVYYGIYNGGLNTGGAAYFGTYGNGIAIQVLANGSVTINSGAPAVIPFSIKLAPGQTANASQVVTSTNAVLQSVSSTGVEQAQAYNTSAHTGFTGTIPTTNTGLLYDHGILWGYIDSTGVTVGN